MSKLIKIDSSILGEASVSKQLTAVFEKEWLAAHPGGEVIAYDLGEEPLKHIDTEFLSSSFMAPDARTETDKSVLAQSDRFIKELREADHIVIGVPMYNFNIPSALKAYFDHIARAGETFRYTENGPEGLLKDIKASLMVATGGDYSQSPMKEMDFAGPYVKTILGFVGIDVENVVTAANLALGEESKAASVAKAKEAITEIFQK